MPSNNKNKTKYIITFPLNEFALYNLLEELRAYNKTIKIMETDVNDQKKLEVIFENFNVYTVYHTADYKHVPLVRKYLL